MTVWGFVMLIGRKETERERKGKKRKGERGKERKEGRERKGERGGERRIHVGVFIESQNERTKKRKADLADQALDLGRCGAGRRGRRGGRRKGTVVGG